MGINRDDKASGHERRRRPRNRTFWNGQLHTPYGRFDCRVVDMSSGGAQVRLAQQPDTPAVPVFGREPVTLVITRLVSAGGVMFVDFYIVRGGKIDVEGLYDDPQHARYGDINWAAIVRPIDCWRTPPGVLVERAPRIH